MNKLNAIGVDLAKNVIQVSVLSPSNRELRNSALTVAEAARRPNVKIASLKTVEQQGMQAIQRSRELLVQQHPGCRRLMELEGVGPISAVLLYATLGTGEAFANGRQFSAYVYHMKEPKTTKDRCRWITWRRWCCSTSRNIETKRIPGLLPH
jgi:hypothetical protein